jgi:hypothetical protein
VPAAESSEQQLEVEDEDGLTPDLDGETTINQEEADTAAEEGGETADYSVADRPVSVEPGEPVSPVEGTGDAGAEESASGDVEETQGFEVAGDSAAETLESDQHSAVDAPPERGVTDLVAGDEAYKKPSSRVSQTSLEFAGRWVVVFIRDRGKVSQPEADDGWVFEFAENGTFVASQHVDGENWQQTGGWEFISDELTLEMGPGGRRTYRVEREGTYLCLLRQADAEIILYCVNLPADAGSTAVARTYQSDFGEVRFRRSGQNYWQGSYGEPQGSLLLRQLGSYLVGSWEQKPAAGFVILQLLDNGFEGVWWYEASTDLDGHWRGSH